MISPIYINISSVILNSLHMIQIISKSFGNEACLGTFAIVIFYRQAHLEISSNTVGNASNRTGQVALSWNVYGFENSFAEIQPLLLALNWLESHPIYNWLSDNPRIGFVPWKLKLRISVVYLNFVVVVVFSTVIPEGKLLS